MINRQMACFPPSPIPCKPGNNRVQVFVCGAPVMNY
jgi:hypothetical protein